MDGWVSGTGYLRGRGEAGMAATRIALGKHEASGHRAANASAETPYLKGFVGYKTVKKGLENPRWQWASRYLFYEAAYSNLFRPSLRLR